MVMNKLITSTFLAIAMLIISTTAVSAAWWFEITTPDVGPTADTWEIRYGSDGESLDLDAFDWYFFGSPTGMGLSGFDGVCASSYQSPVTALPPFDPLYLPTGQPDLILVQFMTGATVHQTLNNGDILFTIESTNPGQLAWYYTGFGSSMSYTDDIGVAQNIDGAGLMAGGYLRPADNDVWDDQNFSDPIPPVPELITVILVIIGLAAIGVYVWQNRRNRAIAST